jgi:NAD(P)-dependent dehydrogenase (short-subunit alcohol dehydrogenase family)
MSLKGAVAVITGSSRGIGRAAAVALARQGAHVVCTARSTDASPSKLPGTIDETVGEIQAMGCRALAVPCDISRDEQVEELAQRTLAAFGGIDILINNAAVTYKAPFVDIPLRRWDLVLGVNLRAPIACVKAFLPKMLQQKSGCIINVSSGAAISHQHTAELRVLPYGVSKAGLETFTQQLGYELQPYNIAVNCLRVDMIIPTEGWKLFNPDADISQYEQPEGAAEAILWLATREPSYTGDVLSLSEINRILRSAPGP